MVAEEEIRKWLKSHDTIGMNGKDIAKAMISEAIQNTEFAEDFYPHLKEKLLKDVQNA